MLMTQKEREQFLETCNLLGVTPFDALGYKKDDLFMVRWEGQVYIPEPVKFMGTLNNDKSLGKFIKEGTHTFLAYFYEVTPYEPSRIPPLN